MIFATLYPDWLLEKTQGMKSWWYHNGKLTKLTQAKDEPLASFFLILQNTQVYRLNHAKLLDKD